MGLFSRKEPWYVAGLAFECVGCGRCCAGPEEGYVWTTTREIAAIAEHLGISEDRLYERYVRKVGRRYSLIEREDNHDCIFLEGESPTGGKCRIYPVRPKQCRTWPFWPANLRGPGAWAMAALRCKGINRGPLHTYDEIEAKRKATCQ